MSTSESRGVYQLPNGMWGYRYAYILNGKQKDLKRTKDENGNPFKTERAAHQVNTEKRSTYKLQDNSAPKAKIPPTEPKALLGDLYKNI